MATETKLNKINTDYMADTEHIERGASGSKSDVQKKEIPEYGEDDNAYTKDVVNHYTK